MAEVRAPSGVIENTGFIGLFGAIGYALQSYVPENWHMVLAIAAPLLGKYAQMLAAKLMGGNLIETGVKLALVGLVLSFGLASTPARAADHPSKAIGCGGGTCSIYFVSASWPPAIGVNAVEWVRGAFGVGIGGVHADGDMSIIGGICLIPKVGDQLGPFCPQAAE